MIDALLMLYLSERKLLQRGAFLLGSAKASRDGSSIPSILFEKLTMVHIFGTGEVKDGSRVILLCSCPSLFAEATRKREFILRTSRTKDGNSKKFCILRIEVRSPVLLCVSES